MEAAEIIELTPTVRLAVHYDTDMPNPRRDWSMLTGAYTAAGRRNRIDVEPVHDFPGNLAYACDDLADEDTVTRWARIFHGITLDYSEGTFWWVDPAELAKNWPDGRYPDGKSKAAWEAEIIASEQQTYRAWAEGDVYGVVVQRLTAWGKLSDDGSTLLQGDGTVREEWEDRESLWGCYLNDEYTAYDVAAESFDFDDPDVEDAIEQHRTHHD